MPAESPDAPPDLAGPAAEVVPGTVLLLGLARANDSSPPDLGPPVYLLDRALLL